MGDGNKKERRMVFVTVETTLFGALVRAADTTEVLFSRGYTHLLVQMGRGSYILTKSNKEDGSLIVDYFTVSSSIKEHLRSPYLVISHEVSGSIFDTLQLGKPLIVVVYEDLMANHHIELAEELAERRHIYCARPQTLHQTIAAMGLRSLLPYPAGDAIPASNVINMFLGFPDD